MIAKIADFSQFVSKVLTLAHTVPYYGHVPAKNLAKVRQIVAKL